MGDLIISTTSIPSLDAVEKTLEIGRFERGAHVLLPAMARNVQAGAGVLLEAFEVAAQIADAVRAPKQPRVALRVLEQQVPDVRCGWVVLYADGRVLLLVVCV